MTRNRTLRLFHLIAGLVLASATVQAQWAKHPSMYAEQWVPSGGAHYVAASFANASSGYIVGGVRAANVSRVNYGVLRTADGGESWSAASAIYPDNDPNITFTLDAVATAGASNVWAVGTYDDDDESYRIHLARSSDGGATWQRSRPLESNLAFMKLARPSADIGLIMGSGLDTQELLVYRTTDGGATWTKAFEHPIATEYYLEEVTQVSFGSSTTGLAAPSGYYFHSAGAPFVYRTADAGNTWVKINLDPGPITDRLGYFAIRQLVWADANTVWALTSNGLYQSFTAGATWQRVTGLPTGVDPTLYHQLVVLNNQTIELLRDDSGELVVTTLVDQGTSWSGQTRRYPIPSLHGGPLLGQAVSLGQGRALSLFSRSLFRTPDGTTSLEPELSEAQRELRVYPNPAAGRATVAAEQLGTGDAEIELINAAGMRVLWRSVALSERRLEQALELGHLPTGLYVVRVRQGQQQRTQRLVLTN